ncbi:uncharacterized protein [Periplaneta americana]|uniref:uncharacterized protein n=1 Tax=Periplaneta americana TaxID=6978 RepID=UPI0037E836EA
MEVIKRLLILLCIYKTIIHCGTNAHQDQEKIDAIEFIPSEITVQDEEMLALEKEIKSWFLSLRTEETNIAFDNESPEPIVLSQTQETTNIISTMPSDVTNNNNLSVHHNENKLLNVTEYIGKSDLEDLKNCPSDCPHKCSVSSNAYDNSYEKLHTGRCKCNCSHKDVLSDTEDVTKKNKKVESALEKHYIVFKNTISSLNEIMSNDTANDNRNNIVEGKHSDYNKPKKLYVIGITPNNNGQYVNEQYKGLTSDYSEENVSRSTVYGNDVAVNDIVIQTKTQGATDTISTTPSYVTENSSKSSVHHNENKLLNITEYISMGYPEDLKDCPSDCPHKCSVNSNAHDNNSYEKPHTGRCKCNCPHEGVLSDTENVIRMSKKVEVDVKDCPSDCPHKCSVSSNAHDNSSYEKPHTGRCKCNCSHEEVLNDTENVTRMSKKVDVDVKDCPSDCPHKCSVSSNAHDNISYEKPHTGRCKCNCSHESVLNDTENITRKSKKVEADVKDCPSDCHHKCSVSSNVHDNSSYEKPHTGRCKCNCSHESVLNDTENVTGKNKKVEGDVKDCPSDCPHKCSFSSNAHDNNSYEKLHTGRCKCNCSHEGVLSNTENVTGTRKSKMKEVDLEKHYIVFKNTIDSSNDTPNCIHNCSDTNKYRETDDQKVTIANNYLTKSLESIVENLFNGTEYESGSNHENIKHIDQSHSDRSLQNLIVHDNEISYKKHEYTEDITSFNTVTSVTSLRTKDDLTEDRSSGNFVLQDSYVPLEEKTAVLPDSLFEITTPRGNGSSNKLGNDIGSSKVGSVQTQATEEILAHQPMPSVTFKTEKTRLNIKDTSKNLKSYDDINVQSTVTTKSDTLPASDKLRVTTGKRAQRRRRFAADDMIISQYEDKTEPYSTKRATYDSSKNKHALLSTRKRSKGEAENTSFSNYFYSVTFPAFFGMLVGIVVCCIMVRAGGWLCRLFSEDSQPVLTEQHDEHMSSQKITV